MAEEERALQQTPSDDVQTDLPDLTGMSLSDLGSVDSEVLNRAVRRAVARRQGTSDPFAAFQSSI